MNMKNGGNCLQPEEKAERPGALASRLAGSA
jgi:hypothetical protein